MFNRRWRRSVYLARNAVDFAVFKAKMATVWFRYCGVRHLKAQIKYLQKLITSNTQWSLQADKKAFYNDFGCNSILFRYLSGVYKFCGYAPYPFSVRCLFDPREYDVFLEIGAGHGELASDWVYKMNTDVVFNKKFRSLYFNRELDKQGIRNNAPVFKKAAVITFEWHKRFWRETRKRILLHCPNNNTGNAGDNKISDNTSYPCCYVPSLAFWDNGYKALKIFSKSSVAGIFVLFPDPWHKKKHKKRRLLTVEFFKHAYKILCSEGFILIVTDHSEYFTFIQEQAYDFIELMANKNKQSPLLQVEEVSSLKALGLVATHYYEKWKRKGFDKFFVLKVQKTND